MYSLDLESLCTGGQGTSIRQKIMRKANPASTPTFSHDTRLKSLPVTIGPPIVGGFWRCAGQVAQSAKLLLAQCSYPIVSKESSKGAPPCTEALPVKLVISASRGPRRDPSFSPHFPWSFFLDPYTSLLLYSGIN